MAFFQQLKLLLWKNGLTVIRRPIWSITLISWPILIFLIMAVTRHQFPPIVRDACYVSPRNLPSAGFFPFLQTLMCNTDSHCYNTSRLADSGTSTSSRDKRSVDMPKASPFATLIQGGDFFNFAIPNNSLSDPAALVKAMESIFGSSHQGNQNSVPLMTAINSTLHEEETIDKMLETINVLKRAICSLTLPMINRTPQSTLTNAVVTFCETNNTMFEVSLQTLNQILTEMLLTKPEEVLSAAGMSVLLFDRLQNETSMWESLLGLPHVLSSGSVDEALSSTEDLLTNIQRTLHIIENSFPGTNESVAALRPLLVRAINLIHYVQNWPGKDVFIPLDAIVTTANSSLLTESAVNYVLHHIQIPLDKAIGLMLDKEVVHFYLCGNSSNPMWLAAACSTGTVDMLLNWICPEKVAKQTFLAWSKHVAVHDVSFVKGLVHSIMGSYSSDAHSSGNITRSRRSVDTQPQSTEEELFWWTAKLILDTAKTEPKLDLVVQSLFRTAFQIIKAAKQTLYILQETMSDVLKDSDYLQHTYCISQTNRSEGSDLISHVFDSVMEYVVESLESKCRTCEERLKPFLWLLPRKTINKEAWEALICYNSSTLNQVLRQDWADWFQQVQGVYYTLTDQVDLNVTLSIFLSEWHELYNSSLQSQELLNRLSTELGGAHWSRCMPYSTYHNLSLTLLNRALKFLPEFGELIEKTEMWPEMKDYFYMMNWVLNYRPDNTTQAANCSVNMDSWAIRCDAEFEWPEFAGALKEALMSPSQEVLVNCLNGTVNLLNSVFGDMETLSPNIYSEKQMNEEYGFSDNLNALMHNLDDFVQELSVLPPQTISDSSDMLPPFSNLLQSSGLEPLVPLLMNEAPINMSTVLAVASMFVRENQHLFDGTDPEEANLEGLITQFLSLDSNLTLSLCHMMKHVLVIYSSSFRPEKVLHPKDAAPANQTSAYFVEAALNAAEHLDEMISSSNADPASIILEFMHELQELLFTLYRLQRIEHVLSPNGELNTTQVTDLDMATMEFLGFFTPEGLENLTQAGPNVAQDIVFQKLAQFLPSVAQKDAAHYLQDLKALQHQISSCAEGQNCLIDFTEIFLALDQISQMMLSADDSITLHVASRNSSWQWESEEITPTFLSLLALNENDYRDSFKQTLDFIKLIMANPNISSVQDVQNALKQSNLTVEELNEIAALAGAANINDLMVNVMEIANSQECFQPQDDTKVTAQCVMGLIDGLSGFLTHLPGLSNNTQILSQIPIIVNKTVSDFIQVDFNSNSSRDFEDIFKNVLANIKVSLQMNDLNNTEIMNEIRVVEGLIQLVTNMDSFNNLNTTLTNDPIQMQKVYLELVEHYLKKLEYISHNSSASALLRPFFHITQMQVTLQLAQTNFSLFVNHKIESLMNDLQYPIDGNGLREIGFTVIEISQHLLDYIKLNLELQKSTLHFDQMFNTTLLYSTDNQIRRYLRVIEKWMKQPDVPTVLTSMLQWGNSSTSSQVTDLSVLLQTMDLFFCDNQKVYLAMIRNISQALSQVLLVPSLQSEQFLPGVLSAAQTAMQLLNTTGVPLPVFVQNDILEIVRDSVNLIFSPDTNFTSSRDTLLHLLEKADGVIQQTVPEMFSGYLLPGIRVAATYFESANKESGPDQWNQIILNEMKTVQSFLPPHSSAQAYVSVIYNVTLFISESGQGNTSVWASFESPFLETLPHIIGQLSKFLSMIWPLVMEETDVQIPVLSLESFIHLVPVMKQISNGNADHNTWEKLDYMLTDLFSVFEKTQVWNGTQHVIPVFEKVMESLVKNMQAENGMVLNLQMPIMTLLSEIGGSLNSSHVKLSDLSDDIQFAIEQTVEAVQQANSTLDCNDVLKIWEPVREAAGFQNDTLRLWCDISLQPLLETNAEAQPVYSNLDTILMSAGPMSANGAADRIVETVQSLYEVNMNRSFVIEQFIMAVSDRLSVMGGQSLSSEAQSHWWSQLQGMEMQNRILYEMEAAQSFLTPNSSAQAYVSILSDIAHFILGPGQGNSYLGASFGNASFETLPELIGQMSKLLNKFWESFVGGPDSEEPAPSLGDFVNLAPVLERLVTGQADQKSWFLLEQMVKNLLIHLGGIMSPNRIQNGIYVFEKNVENIVKKQQEEAALIQSLQLPLGSLMREIATTMNSSEINLFDLSETVGSAVENTMQTVRQANGTLNCNNILEAWEPLREAGGLTHDNLTLWCENSLWPVLDAFIANQTAFSSQNMSHPEINPFNLTVETDKIIKAVQSLYNVNINQAFVVEHFVKSFSNLNFGTTNQTVDTEMLMHLLQQFQDMQVQSSFSALKELSDELVSLDPELQPYIEASEKAMSLILTNYDHLLNGSSSQELFEDALIVFLTSANLTLDQILMVTSEDSEDNFISLNDLIMEALNLVLEMSLFGEDSMAYQALEELLASNDTSLLGERLVDFFVWLTSTETPDLDWFSLTLTKAYDIVRPTLSLLTKMDVRMSSCAELFEDLARNIIAMLRQFVTTSDLLPPMYDQTGVLHEEMMNNFNQGKVRHRRDVSSVAQPTLINDFGDLFRIDYPSMFRAISQSPASSEMIETAHVLFANPDLNVVVKGATTNMSWGLNASREATIDSALGMFSFLSHPDLLTSPPMDILTNATNGLPDAIPFSSVIKNFTKTLASESPDTLIRMQQAVQTTVQLLQSHPKSSEFTQQLQQLKSQLCPLESTQSMQQVMSTLSLQPGQLCNTYLPSLEVLAKNSTSMSDLLFQAVIGEPKNYKIQANWTSVLTEALGFNTTSLDSLNMNFTLPVMTVGEMLRNRAAFAQDVQQHLAINPSDLDPLMNTTLPNDNLEVPGDVYGQFKQRACDLYMCA